MPQLRRFKNTDPPHLAEIWKSQPPQRGLMQPISASLLEHCVYSKQYFDPAGLIVATVDDEPIGFAHAGFGAAECGCCLEKEIGVTQMVLVHERHRDPATADALLAESEAYLRQGGARVLYGGGIHPLNPFYLGLYGGSELPGVLQSDTAQQELFVRNNYGPAGEVAVLQRELSRFRSLVSRTQRQLRREVKLECELSPQPPNWFEACQTSGCDDLEFALVRKSDGTRLASVKFWEIEPLATSWGIRTAGLCNLLVDEANRRRGLATHLLSEAFKEVQKRGISMIEVHTMADNAAALALYEKLGFTKVDTGVVFRRNGSG